MFVRCWRDHLGLAGQRLEPAPGMSAGRPARSDKFDRMTVETGLRLSLVICTHDRARLLEDALGSLARQGVPADVGVIVVDNQSGDATVGVAAAFARRHSWLRYCVEPRLGPVLARNTGLREARGRYVAYVDDDCRLPAGWLTAALHVLDQIGPDVFGGPYFAAYNSSRPY